jgi:hypothetical protein
MFVAVKKSRSQVAETAKVLRNSARASLLACSVCSVSLAAPAPKPATNATATVSAGKPAGKPEPAKASAEAAKKGQATAVGQGNPAVPIAAKPRPVVARAIAAAPPRHAETASPRDDVAALSSEVKSLRADLNRAVGMPGNAPDPERERLETGLAAEQKKLVEIEAAVDAGLDRSVVADSIANAQRRVAELQAELAKLPPATPVRTRSLSEISAEVEQLHSETEKQSDPVSPQAAEVVAASTPPKPLIDVSPPSGGELMGKMGLLPLEFTAFGDFFYRFERPGSDAFHVGAVELDASLKLTPYVNVSTALVFDGTEDDFALAAFVIDCGIAGDGEGYVLQSKRVSKSGVSFGRFDVPFGIAYLQYPAVENRLVTLPHAVELTHGAWNDVGAQGYAVGEHWTAVGYVVNGPEHPISVDATAASRTAAGGRLSGKVDDLIEVGASGALDFAAAGPVMAFGGGDLQTTLGPLDVRGEYLLKHVKVAGLPELTHGIYGQAFLKLDPAFLMARYDTVLEGSKTFDRSITAGAGVEVFSQGEVRAVYEQSLDSDIRMLTLQLVGGSSFQPTGLRR